MKKIQIIERGYPGHFVLSDRCVFRRNTLIDAGDTKVVVSTVGNCRPDDRYKIEPIAGDNIYYETMVFGAIIEGIYLEADIGSPINVDSKHVICKITEDTDYMADQMHENVIKEMVNKLKNDER